MTKRNRSAFTPQLKTDAVRLVKAGERGIAQIAKGLDLTGCGWRPRWPVQGALSFPEVRWSLARAAGDDAIVAPIGRYRMRRVHGRLPGEASQFDILHFISFNPELGFLLDALDTALASLSASSRLVLDVRRNGGRSDVDAVDTARRAGPVESLCDQARP